MLKKVLTNALVFIVSLAFVVVLAEVAFECYTFQKEHFEYSALVREIKERVSPSDPDDDTTSQKNPFIEYDSTYGYKLHPFIDFTGVHGHELEFTRWDYFGFRNDENLYFTPKDCVMVVITGGSEAAGQSHRKTIAQNLEGMLNARGGRKFRVLNLSMNSYTISNEINAYVHLAYHLRPEYVISHTAYNDMLYSLMVPYYFKQMGLIYYKNMELWMPRLYDLKWRSDKAEHKLNGVGAGVVVDAFIGNLKKYRTIVETNGGRFIAGMQGFNMHLAVSDKEIHTLAGQLMIGLNARLREEAPGVKYVDFSRVEGIDFVDPVHSTEESASLIASVYADIILGARAD